MRLLKRLFYNGKYCRETEKDGLTAMLLPSILGIFLCTTCLVGMTFAWFTASQTTPTQLIQTANYSVQAFLDGELLTGPTAVSAGTHTLTIVPNGTATTGYCILEVDGVPYQTEQIAKAVEFSLTITVTITAETPVTLTLTAQWGTAANQENVLTSGSQISVGTQVS